MLHRFSVPISEEAISALHVGDQVRLSGVIVTARDAAHKLMIEKFIQAPQIVEHADLYARLKELLAGGVIYHCGPVVSQDAQGHWHFVAAGPTTSIREEPYEAEVIEHFGLRAVIGKGGMGPKTLKACHDHKAVYLHAIGGAASLIANSVQDVVDVYQKDELGVPEAFWVIRVEDFPAVVTMDSHGNSLHAEVKERSTAIFQTLVGVGSS
ncbi:MAG: FumA C-terminus/TtdB family hydratase beta subunit [Anaerolineae bacterium]|jgi:fumarate hydratase subunit beta